MKTIHSLIPALLAGAIIIATGCNDRRPTPVPPVNKAVNLADSGYIKIAADINYDVIVIPPTGSDPWESERVSGYDGSRMIDYIFENIYAGTITPYDLVTGEPIATDEIRKLENEAGTDRSMIAKLQFTEDWYYNAADGQIRKIVKSITLGREFRDSMGNMFGYKALFKLVMAE
jgi:hypothetical protein